MAPTADKSAVFSQLIKSWVAENGGRNLYALAKSSGLSYTNLRSIVAGKSDVTIDTALRLLRYIQPDSATTQTILNLFPDIAPMLSYLSQQKAKPGAWRLLSPRACRAAVEIYGRRLLPRDELQRVLGRGTESAVRELLAAGLIQVEEGCYKPSQDFFHFNSPDVLIPLLRLFLDNLSHEDPWNLVEARFTGLKPEAAAEIQAILEDARLRILSIKKDPENAGDVNLAWGLLMTRF
jgi:plasmid maintenance system antidote protein VapI